MDENNKIIGKKIKEIVDNFYKTPIGDLPKDHFWIDRDNHLCCGQIRSKIIVDNNEIIQQAKKDVFDKFREILEAHRNVSMVTCPEDCFCWKIDTELMKEELQKSSSKSCHRCFREDVKIYKKGVCKYCYNILYPEEEKPEVKKC